MRVARRNKLNECRIFPKRHIHLPDLGNMQKKKSLRNGYFLQIEIMNLSLHCQRRTSARGEPDEAAVFCFKTSKQ